MSINYNQNKIDVRIIVGKIISLIQVLMDNITSDGEKGVISEITRNSAIKLFNLMVRNGNLIVIENSIQQVIVNLYNSTNSQSAYYYGVRLIDPTCRYNKFMVKKIVANDGFGDISLDRLTVTNAHYINNLLDPDFVSYYDALISLKQHFESILCSLNIICC